MEEWFAFKMFLAFWLRSAHYMRHASVYDDPYKPSVRYLAIDFEYVFNRSRHVAECDASVKVGRFTWLRLAWRASRTWR
jgi:hypothetical protein